MEFPGHMFKWQLVECAQPENEKMLRAHAGTNTSRGAAQQVFLPFALPYFVQSIAGRVGYFFEFTGSILIVAKLGRVEKFFVSLLLAPENIDARTRHNTQPRFKCAPPRVI